MASREIRGFFLTTADEADFSSRLRGAIRDVSFLDDDRKPIASISDATSLQAWIGRGIAEASPMIQFLRCRVFEREGHSELRVGRMAIVYADDETRAFVDAAWREFRRLCVNRLIAHDFSNEPNGTTVRDVWLGPDARRWHERGGRLASNAAGLHYTVP